VRLTSRLGQTPGDNQPEQFEVPPSAQVTAAPAASGGVRSILKRLNFSTTKARRQAAAAASAAQAQGPFEAGPSTSGAQPQAQSTIKQLRFDLGATPSASTASRQAQHRHVTFEAATVSPATRTCTAKFPAPGTAAQLRTPTPPTIQEEGSGEGSEDVGGGSVNSAAAGHTPYDRRLSSLFRKYQVAGTPELADDELDELVANGKHSGVEGWGLLQNMAALP
jgi:hypothetical protein